MLSRKFSYCVRAARFLRPKLKREFHFVDWRRVSVKSGDGADGCVHFRRLKYQPRAGPDGGDGGSGGSVVFIADKSYRDLSHLQSLYKARNGGKGSGEDCHGKNSPDVIIKVPPGTIIKEENTDEILADLDSVNDRSVVAQGGVGGYGNAAFSTATNKTPEEGSPGTLGEEKVLHLELKTLADVGLVGFPNAGKSTLLRALSKAKPAVASYPFTTLNPHVGIIHYKDFVEIAVADIPGLIEGAHLNKGLGHSFLRHIERCHCLLYVIDSSEPDPQQNLKTLQNELELYRKGLSHVPSAIVANKIDLYEKKELDDLLKYLKQETQLPVLAISAQEHWNIDKLKTHIRQLFDKALKQSFTLV